MPEVSGKGHTQDKGSGLPQRDAGVPCENCGCEKRRPRINRCAACGRFAPDPIYAYSRMTDAWYRVYDWDGKGEGRIVAKSKEEVERSEVPERWIDAIEVDGDE